HGQDDGDSFDVYARRYYSTGSALGSEFRVNSHTSSQEWISSVALSNYSHFAISWTSNGQDGDGDGVYAQAFDSTGSEVNDEIAVNTTTGGHQSHSSIAIDNSGNYTVGWMSVGQDGNDAGVYYRYFGVSGYTSPEFKANSTTAGAQNYPAIVISPQTTIGVSWASDDQDGDGFGIYTGLFFD
ncbi:MAG TPA: hypothetical protein V6D23_24255, partial [Candidatus Obscuribacterales bacterium]